MSGVPDTRVAAATADNVASIRTVGGLARVLRQLRRREARRRGGAELTYREIADKTGWSLGAVGEYLSGRILPPIDRFDALILLLGATPAEQGALATARDRVEERRRETPLAVPRQLPAAARHFAGRSTQVAALTALADQAAARQDPPGAGATVVISAIDGTAGIGKTTLAVHWAHLVADRFDDGQVYLNLRGFDPAGAPMTPAEAMRGLLDAFGVPPRRIPAGLEAQAGLLRSLLADRRVLLLLDNARDVEQVRPLLPGAPGCLVLVTSRNRLASLITAEQAHPLTLDLLSCDEARDLLISRLGRARVVRERRAADDIIALCARLPLALAIVTARAAAYPEFPLASLAAELRAARGRLDALDGGDPTTDIRSVFSWSYRTLGGPAARLFRLLGLHPGVTVGTAAAASLAGIDVEQVRPLLAELARANLVTEHLPARFVFHDLLRAYAAELADAHDPSPERRAAAYRLLDHYLHTAHAGDLLLHPHRDTIVLAPPVAGVTPDDLADDERAMAWFDAEHAALLAAVEQATDTGLDQQAWQLAWALTTFLDRQGHWQEWAATISVALEATRRLADLPAQAHAHRVLGHVYSRLDRFDESYEHLRAALDLAGGLGDHIGRAQVFHNLGYVCMRQGRDDEALHYSRQALDLYRTAGHQAGQAKALNAIGWFHAQLGHLRRARVYCRRALGLLRTIDDRYGEAHTWDSLGYVHRHLDEHDEALACYRQALGLFRELGDRNFEAEALTHLGDTHHDAGELDAARAAWRRALDILDELGHPDEAERVRDRLVS